MTIVGCALGVAAVALGLGLAFWMGARKGRAIGRVEQRILSASEVCDAYTEGAQMAAATWRRTYDENHERWRAAYVQLHLTRSERVDMFSALLQDRPRKEKPS